MRVLKWLAGLFGLLLVLVVIAVAVIRFLIDPNDYKDQISQLVQENTGYHLRLGGDLSWSFYPILGFASNDVALATAQQGDAFLQVGKLSIGLQLMPLFSAQVMVDQLQIEGVKANFIVDKQGRPNWEVVAAETAQSAPSGVSSTSAPVTAASDAGFDASTLPEFSIPLIRILDASLRYQDLQAKTDASVNIHKLELTDVQLRDPVAFLLEASLAQVGGPALDLTLTGKVKPDLQAQRYELSKLELATTVKNVLPAPLAVKVLADVMVDLAADQAAVDLQQLAAAGAVLSGKVEVDKLTADPTFKGKLASQPLAIKTVMGALGQTLPATANPAVLNASINLGFNGSTSQLRVPSLNLKLDDSTLSGSLAVTDFTTQALTFDLKLDHINLDDYLPPASAETAAAGSSGAASAPADATLIPVEPLRSLNLKGKLQVGKIIVQQEAIDNLQLAISAHNGLVQVTDLQAALLSGTVAGSLALDARGKEPQLDTDLKVQGVELTSVSQRFMSDALLSGKASFDMDAKASGNTVDTLLRSALGNMDMKLDDGVLHGVNLNALVVDALRGQLKTVESLYPSYQEQLPRQLKEDTDISRLLAKAKIENGQLIMPDFEFFTGESGIDASGKVDLVNLGFDYNFGVALSAVERNKYLQGSRWPVRCKGSFSGSPADWCRPDLGAMGSILKKAAGTALKDKTASEIGDKVGVKAEDREQLKQEAKQKADEEEERAKRKLQEKLNKWLER